MGLFSFIGKALKGVSKVASFVPGIGGTISKVSGIAGNILDHKRPMQKQVVRNPVMARGNITQSGAGYTAQVLRGTPIMPGGAIATPSGVKPHSGGRTPMRFGGVSTGSSVRKRSTTKRRKRASTSSRRKRTTTRKLKFGSPAWRKKYMKRR